MFTAALLCVMQCAAAEDAHAAPTLTDKAVAQALFEEGKTAMAAGRVDEACTKFTESYRVDPSAGALLNLGVCHERQGRLATAYAEFSESVRRAILDQRPEREQLAREHMVAIAPKVPKLSVRVGAAAAVQGLVITLDATPLAAAAWGSALPVDPGDHFVTASAPSKRTWQRVATVGSEPGLLVVDVPALEDAPAASTSITTPAPREPASPPPPNASDSAGASRLRVIGWSLAGAGAAGVVVGSVLGVAAIAKWNQTACANAPCPSTDLTSRYDAAGTLADASTVAFIGGGTFLAIGTLLVLLSPRNGGGRSSWQVSPLVGAGGTGIVLSGAH